MLSNIYLLKIPKYGEKIMVRFSMTAKINYEVP